MRLSLPRIAALLCIILPACLASGQASSGVSPSSINLLGIVGGGNTGGQALTITTAGFNAGASWTAIPSTQSGGNWLGVQPQTGIGTSSVVVYANAGNLPVGTYQGHVTVTIGTDSPIIVPVTFNVAASIMTFQTGAGGTNPAPQTLQLTLANTGSVKASWTASVFTYDGANWLSVSPTSGSGTSLSVSVNATGLAVGTYFGYVTVNGANPPQTPVQFNVTAPGPSVSPASLAFSSTLGVSPAAQTLTLTIPSGSAATSWTVASTTTTGGSWLSATPTSGSAGGTITVTANATGLAAGNYAGTVTITFPGASGTSSAAPAITVPVTLTLTNPSQPTLAPSQLAFTAPGTAAPASQTLQLTIPSAASITGWTATAATTGGGNWLTVTPTSGTATGTITVSASPTGLPAGLYNGTITVSFTGGSPTPTSVQTIVSFSVGTITVPSVSPTQLTFTAAANATSNPPTQTVQLTIPASLGNLNWSLTAATAGGGQWIAVTPGSGTGNGTITVGVSIGGLPTGSYAGAVFIGFSGAPSGSTVTPISIPVFLNIGTTATATAAPSQLNFSAPGTSNPAAQTFALTLPSSAANAVYVVSTLTLNGAFNWLSSSPNTGNGDGTITIGVNVAGLTPGVYNGQVIITFPNAPIASVIVPVTLTATLQTLSVSPTSLAFTATATMANPATQIVNVTVDPSLPNWTAAAVTTSGGNWLTITPSTGVGNGTIVVSANVGTLVGQYVGQVLVTAGAESASFTVTFNVATTGISVMPTALAFTANAGAPAATQVLTLSSSIAPGTTWQASASTTTGGNWLSVAPSAGQLPAAFFANANTSGLAPGSYMGAITIADAQANPPLLTVPVTLTVNPVANGTLSVTPLSLNLQGVVGVNPTATPSITISSTASTAQTWSAAITTSNGGNWLGLTASSGNVSLTSPAVPQLLITSGSLTAGVYAGQIAVQFGASSSQAPQVINVQLTMTPAGPVLALGQSAVQLSAFAGSNSFVTQGVPVANTGTGTLNWTANVVQPLPQVSTGPNWLLVAAAGGATGFTAIGTATATAPGTMVVVVNAGSLAAGTYYGLVGVTQQNTTQAMQYLTVVLTVLPSGPPLNAIYPLSLMFVEGGPSPAQTVSVLVGNSTVSESVTVGVNTPWLTAQPTSFSALTGNVTIGLTNASLTLAAGVYHSVVTIAPQGYSSLAQDVQITYIVPPTTGVLVSTCTATSLVMGMRQLPANFNYVTGQPAGLEVQLLDNCGKAATNATVTATFSNGDPGLTLTNLGNGIYSATWNPVTANAATAVTIQAVQSPLTSANTTVNGVVTANSATTPPPFIGVGGAVNGASFAPLQDVAPGSIISVFGGNLATSNGNLASFPLPTVLGGIKLSMGGEDLPLFYSGTGQVNAQVPFDLPVNERASLVARAVNSTSELDSAPIGVTLGAAQPGIFLTGTASQGAILNAKNVLVDSNAPATAGDVIVIFCTGLGPTAPTVTTGQPSPAKAIVTTPATVMVGGMNATVQFAGLAPGFVGLYQVNAVVPTGVPAGPAVAVVITQNGISSNSATIAVH